MTSVTTQSAFWERNGTLSRRIHEDNVPIEDAHYTYRHQRSYYKAAIGYVTALAWAIGLFTYADLTLSLETLATWIFLTTTSLYLGVFAHYYLRLVYYNQELAREQWETENYLEGEISEMVTLYEKRHNFQREDAISILRTMSKNQVFFVDHMMNVELNMSNANLKSPHREALYPTTSFAISSGILLLPFTQITFWNYRWVYLTSIPCLVSITTITFIFIVESAAFNYPS